MRHRKHLSLAKAGKLRAAYTASKASKREARLRAIALASVHRPDRATLVAAGLLPVLAHALASAHAHPDPQLGTLLDTLLLYTAESESASELAAALDVAPHLLRLVREAMPDVAAASLPHADLASRFIALLRALLAAAPPIHEALFRAKAIAVVLGLLPDALAAVPDHRLVSYAFALLADLSAFNSIAAAWASDKALVPPLLDLVNSLCLDPASRQMAAYAVLNLARCRQAHASLVACGLVPALVAALTSAELRVALTDDALVSIALALGALADSPQGIAGVSGSAAIPTLWAVLGGLDAKPDVAVHVMRALSAVSAVDAASDFDPASLLPTLLRHLVVGGPPTVLAEVTSILAFSGYPASVAEQVATFALAQLACRNTPRPLADSCFRLLYRSSVLLPELVLPLVIPGLLANLAAMVSGSYVLHQASKALLQLVRGRLAGPRKDELPPAAVDELLDVLFDSEPSLVSLFPAYFATLLPSAALQAPQTPSHATGTPFLALPGAPSRLLPSSAGLDGDDSDAYSYSSMTDDDASSVYSYDMDALDNRIRIKRKPRKRFKRRRATVDTVADRLRREQKRQSRLRRTRNASRARQLDRRTVFGLGAASTALFDPTDDKLVDLSAHRQELLAEPPTPVGTAPIKDFVITLALADLDLHVCLVDLLVILASHPRAVLRLETSDVVVVILHTWSSVANLLASVRPRSDDATVLRKLLKALIALVDAMLRARPKYMAHVLFFAIDESAPGPAKAFSGYAPVALPRLAAAVLRICMMEPETELLDVLTSLLTFMATHTAVLPLLLSLGDGGSITAGFIFHVVERVLGRCLEHSLAHTAMDDYRFALGVAARLAALAYELLLAVSVTAPFFRDPENRVVVGVVQLLAAKLAAVEPFELADTPLLLALLGPVWLLSRLSRYASATLHAPHADGLAAWIRLLRAAARKGSKLAPLPLHLILGILANLAAVPSIARAMLDSPIFADALTTVARSRPTSQVVFLTTAIVRRLAPTPETLPAALSWLTERMATVRDDDDPETSELGTVAAEQVRVLLRTSARVDAAELSARRKTVLDGRFVYPAGLMSSVTYKAMHDPDWADAKLPPDSNVVAFVDAAFKASLRRNHKPKQP
ncbi:uncharacterized protein AMSG_04937 [Thecamonas trahens ATCC 50062]|uniref:Uncharacterized protein n=1 Tax=Thecamonas trahens ATCC 50062 TaxID=461836 RepID=A0A0L0D813_THETB|nr:hypothetical protein AMSG_04937 [Thecamonas trahens ATCC 50062]KNC48489.1 hypothetical protein AMSG_04937 [Thecamonas trahens ATCC 50062]|eukprot:XP_013758601.1 hypothetical protein AMSG_04937 [Thecamonas trahens ATCC 50062]